MNWQPIETYPKPDKEWDLDWPSSLFYSKQTGVVIGHCIRRRSRHHFEYSDGWSFEPTHWMPLPDAPEGA